MVGRGVRAVLRGERVAGLGVFDREERPLSGDGSAVVTVVVSECDGGSADAAVRVSPGEGSPCFVAAGVKSVRGA